MKYHRQSVALHSLSRVPPSSVEAEALHSFWLQHGQQGESTTDVQRERVWMGDTRLEKCMLMFPQERKWVRSDNCFFYRDHRCDWQCAPKGFWWISNAARLRGWFLRHFWEALINRFPLLQAWIYQRKHVHQGTGALPIPGWHLVCSPRSDWFYPSPYIVYPPYKCFCVSVSDACCELRFGNLLLQRLNVFQHVGVKANVVDVKTGSEQTTNDFRFTWCREQGEGIPRMVVPKTYKGMSCPSRSLFC